MNKSAKSERTDENERLQQQPFKKSKSGTLPQGTPVICNGYRGAIIRHYDGAMYEIRLPRGSVCTDQFRIIDYAVDTSPAEQPAKQGEPEWANCPKCGAYARTRDHACRYGEHSPDDDGKISREEWRELALSRYERMEHYRNYAEKLAAALRDIAETELTGEESRRHANAALAEWDQANSS